MFVYKDRTSVAFSEFELVVLKHLYISPSQLHMGSWAYIRVFQLYTEHNSWKPSLNLFFYLLYLRRTSLDNFHNQGLISFHLVYPWFDPFTLDWGDFPGSFFLVKPLTLVVLPIFCYIPIDFPQHF